MPLMLKTLALSIIVFTRWYFIRNTFLDTEGLVKDAKVFFWCI